MYFRGFVLIGITAIIGNAGFIWGYYKAYIGGKRKLEERMPSWKNTNKPKKWFIVWVILFFPIAISLCAVSFLTVYNIIPYEGETHPAFVVAFFSTVFGFWGIMYVVYSIVKIRVNGKNKPQKPSLKEDSSVLETPQDDVVFSKQEAQTQTEVSKDMNIKTEEKDTME